MLKQPELVAKHIVSWLSDYADSAQASGFVVGISGGIDSAVTASLCARTGMKVWGIEMPIHQHPDHVSRAQQMQSQLGASFDNFKTVRVDLTPVFEAFINSNPSESGQEKTDLSLANSRARLRMTTLYYHATLNNALVAGTGNKVEDFGVGFYTKYGDGGVDLSPIADLMKSEVYQLGHFLKVPETILNAAPSDGLFGDARSDEDQIGANYDELEWAMNVSKESKSLTEFTDRQQEVMRIYSQFNRKNKHKMVPIPVCQIPATLKS
jgi:NAD+ synthase